jgi:hypothetical protein
LEGKRPHLRHQKHARRGHVEIQIQGGETMKKCKHLDGWLLFRGSLVIDPNQMNEDYEAEFICNHIDCRTIKKFKFDIKNIEEMAE